MTTRYQKITSMEPSELAEFLDNYEENMFGTCNSRFCEYSTEGGGCKEATIKWLLSEVPGEGESVAETPSVSCADTSLKEGGLFTREDILREAIKCVCTDRNEQYGEPEDNFDCIAGYWQKFLCDHCVEYGAGVCITPEDVAVMMMLFKIARYITAERPSVDTFVDIAGYAACAGEICERRRRSVKNEE